MKTNQPEGGYTLTYQPAWQEGEFTITNLAYDDGVTISQAVEAEFQAEKRQYLASRAIAATAAPTQPTEQILTGRKAAVAARLYDVRFGTKFYEALLDKKSIERDLQFAGRIGLLTEDVCAKHRKALGSVKSL